MRNILRAISALCLVFAPLPLAAQDGDAFVLPRGVLRFHVGGELIYADARFAASGDSTEPLTADLLAPLTSESFAPLLTAQTGLNQLLSATDDLPGATPLRADPETFLLGTPDLAAALSTRIVPFRLELGVLPRLELSVALPLLQEERFLTRAGVIGGNAGPNPDRTFNAQAFAQLGEEWRTLGALPVLPTDSSALGKELQRRVLAVGEVPLELPDSAADLEDLNALLASEFGLAPLGRELDAWRPGDLQVGLRFRVLSSFGDAPLPADSGGVHYRAALSASARLPTGTEPDSLHLLTLVPQVGQSGFGLGLDGDLFVGPRFWASLSARYSASREVEVVRRVVPLEQPLVSTAAARNVRWSPASQLALRLAPRFRLTEAIDLGAHYTIVRIGESTYEAADAETADPLPSGFSAPVLNTPAGTVQQAGLSARYSTLPDYWAGRTGIPLAVSLSYEATFSGPARWPAARRVLVAGNLFVRLWGRTRSAD